MGQSTVKEFVVRDFRAAAIFERHGIDFCCKGGVSLETACAEKGLDPALLYRELEGLAPADETQERYDDWELDALVGHIVSKHHRYVRSTIPILRKHTAKVASVHGERHPEVLEIGRLFEAVADEMHSHMFKEEMMLFPYINALASARRNGAPAPVAPFGTVANPIRMMEAEHSSAGGAMERIRALSSGYEPPADACTTYRVSYEELRQFELDLHTHVHLENNILFPGAVALETAVR